jgi:hypothetical protein
MTESDVAQTNVNLILRPKTELSIYLKKKPKIPASPVPEAKHVRHSGFGLGASDAPASARRLASPMPVCALASETPRSSKYKEYFEWDPWKKATVRKELAIRMEPIVSLVSYETLSNQ